MKETMHVRLTPYANSWGVKTELDGVEVQEVAGINLTCPVDDLAQLHLTVNVRHPFEVALPAAVHVHFSLPEGCIITDTLSTDGKEFRVIKTQEAETPDVRAELEAVVQEMLSPIASRVLSIDARDMVWNWAKAISALAARLGE